VKVLPASGSGKTSDVIKGIEWIVDSHLKKKEKMDKGWKGSVLNISIGGPKSLASERAVNAAVGNGLHIAIAAGNDNESACKHSPAGAEKAITVGASTVSDERAWFSNHGVCVDIFAPGVEIPGPWKGDGDEGVRNTSGTSTTSPHVAGLLAYFLSLMPDRESEYWVRDMEPKKMKEIVLGVATRGVLKCVPDGTENVSLPVVWFIG